MQHKMQQQWGRQPQQQHHQQQFTSAATPTPTPDPSGPRRSFITDLPRANKHQQQNNARPGTGSSVIAGIEDRLESVTAAQGALRAELQSYMDAMREATSADGSPLVDFPENFDDIVEEAKSKEAAGREAAAAAPWQTRRLGGAGSAAAAQSAARDRDRKERVAQGLAKVASLDARLADCTKRAVEASRASAGAASGAGRGGAYAGTGPWTVDVDKLKRRGLVRKDGTVDIVARNARLAGHGDGGRKLTEEEERRVAELMAGMPEAGAREGKDGGEGDLGAVVVPPGQGFTLDNKQVDRLVDIEQQLSAMLPPGECDEKLRKFTSSEASSDGGGGGGGDGPRGSGSSTSPGGRLNLVHASDLLQRVFAARELAEEGPAEPQQRGKVRDKSAALLKKKADRRVARQLRRIDDALAALERAPLGDVAVAGAGGSPRSPQQGESFGQALQRPVSREQIDRMLADARRAMGIVPRDRVRGDAAADDDGDFVVNGDGGVPSSVLAPRKRIEALVHVTRTKAAAAHPQVTPCEAYRRMQREAQNDGGNGGGGGDGGSVGKRGQPGRISPSRRDGVGHVHRAWGAAEDEVAAAGSPPMRSSFSSLWQRRQRSKQGKGSGSDSKNGGNNSQRRRAPTARRGSAAAEEDSGGRDADRLRRRRRRRGKGRGDTGKKAGSRAGLPMLPAARRVLQMQQQQQQQSRRQGQ